VIVAAGDLIGPAEVGLLATVGVTSVPVYARPVVAVLSTGDEIVEPTENPKPGQIRDSNRAMLKAALAEHIPIGNIIDLGIAPDTKHQLQKQIHSALEKADMLITSGGVSMGQLDLIKPLLMESAQVHFGRILMKPGKPCTFATMTLNNKKKYIFALPGNPVSSIVCFDLFAVPAIRKMSGYCNPHLTSIQVKLKNKIKLDPERPEYHRATLTWSPTDKGVVAHSTGAQTSSRLLSMRSANGLLVLPQQDGELQIDTFVEAFLLGPIFPKQQ